MQSLVRGVGRALAARRRARATHAGADSPLRRLLRDASAHSEVGAAAEGELQWATQPYASAPGAEAPRSDPAEAAVLLFPGQGAQFVGMGRRLQDTPAAMDLYNLASSVVGYVS